MNHSVNIILVRDGELFADYFSHSDEGPHPAAVLEKVKDSINKAGNPQKLTAAFCRPVGTVLYYFLSVNKRHNSVGVCSHVQLGVSDVEDLE